jgi:Ala-tRNA(Pro) deacylase
MKVQQYLRDHGVWFEREIHPPAYNALRLADVVGVPAYAVAKTVLLRVDGHYVLAVLPANYQVSLRRLREILDLDRVELANEAECEEYFDDCEKGVIPPFGSQYGMQTVVAESLVDDDQIVFEGNRHDEAIRMRFADYCRLERPRVLRFSECCH